ncbi:MAG: tripartite tricarboxylate transporter TctB family protein [Beijerinckiaceae bacterium]|nr:tripartite tricarboxylate transporter TctB family protein [Beijerinckiaceae bacterium]
MRKDLIRDGDVISGAAIAALGVYIISVAAKWDYMSIEGPGPGFFPIWYGIAMVVLSLALIGSKYLKPAVAVEREPIDWPGFSRAFATWLGFVVCAALLKPLGFTISFALLCFFLVAYVFRRPLRVALITAVVSSIAFYLVFSVALNVSLPTGLVGF